ncbi:hypothetical protein [Gemmata sp.]|uniref:hypothetical protein n=1 Tax=Gemmata sp. TaxID=1914242 RepID=UPI003F716334
MRWAASADPEIMLRMRPAMTDRKRRLVLAACCRACWEDLSEWSREAIVAAESWLDGPGSDRERAAAEARVDSGLSEYWRAGEDLRAAMEDTTGEVAAAGLAALRERYWRADRVQRVADVAQSVAATGYGPETLLDALRLVPAAAGTALLRCVFCNPFRPVAFDAAWRTDTAVSLARHIYESRDFGAMPILADALQDAGCDSDDVLDHCRGAGPHVRGCWVVDLVLGKG